MGKNNIRKGILRSLCAAVTAFAAAAVPVMGGTTFADTKDYDQEIAQLEQKAEQIKKDNEAREQQIGSLKSDVAENEQKMGLLQRADIRTNIMCVVHSHTTILILQQMYFILRILVSNRSPWSR